MQGLEGAGDSAPGARASGGAGVRLRAAPGPAGRRGWPCPGWGCNTIGLRFGLCGLAWTLTAANDTSSVKMRRGVHPPAPPRAGGTGRLHRSLRSASGRGQTPP